MVGLGWANYWKVGWNRFDLLLVASSLADMLVSLIGGADVRALKIQKVMRLLRLARVVKLVRGMTVRAPARARASRGGGMVRRSTAGAGPLSGSGRRPRARRGVRAPLFWIGCPAHARKTAPPLCPPARLARAQGVRSLFGTLIVSLPAFWNVGALLGLLFYIYAYIGEALPGAPHPHAAT